METAPTPHDARTLRATFCALETENTPFPRETARAGDSPIGCSAISSICQNPAGCQVDMEYLLKIRLEATLIDLRAGSDAEVTERDVVRTEELDRREKDDAVYRIGRQEISGNLEVRGNQVRSRTLPAD